MGSARGMIAFFDDLIIPPESRDIVVDGQTINNFFPLSRGNQQGHD
jgi:hypothetical protein